MVKYYCQRCGYETSHKSVFKNHLLRKFICEPINEDIGRYQLLVMNNFDQEAHKFNISSKNIQFHHHKIEDNICKYCNKKLSNYKNKWRHEKTCKEKINKDKIIEDLQNNNKMLKEVNKKTQLENKKTQLELAELKKTVEQLILNQGKNMVQPKLNNGTINNVGNVKNMKNKTNIQINNYGCENIDYITDKVFKKLLNTPMSAIQKLIEYKHFHPDHPENHNVKITNIHDKYAKIYKDKKWLVKHKKDIVEDLVENGYADFEEFKNLNEDQLAEKVKEKFEMMQKKFNNNFETICKSSELSIINGSNP